MNAGSYDSNDGFHPAKGNIILPEGGTIKRSGGTVPVIALVTTPNGSDAATTQTLANALKVKVNEIITALANAGISTTS